MGWRSGRLGVRGAMAFAGAVLSLAASSYAPAAEAAVRGPHIIFSIDVARIKESSSLVDSTADPGLVYTANDSGDGPFVYVLDRSGHLVGTTTLSGVDPVDIEAMSVAADGSLVVGDVGDNLAVRDSVQVYRIAQPTAGDHTVTPEKVTLTYSNGPRNAESVLYDASSGRVLVVSKELDAHVYTTPPDAFSRTSATLTPVAAAPSIATDATFLPGGGAVVIRTYRRAVVYQYPSWVARTSFLLPIQVQGESVCAVPGKAEIWVGSEGVDSPVWLVPLDLAAARFVSAGGTTTTGTPTPVRGEEAATAGRQGSRLSLVSLGGGAGALVVVVAAAVLLSRNRRRRRGSGSAG